MRRLPARRVYVFLSASSALIDALMFTVLPVYFVSTVKMNALQLVLVGTALEGTVLLLEVPTGVIADTFSHRLSVIIGMAVLGAGFVLTGLAPWFGWILAAQVINGAGYTFLSGALDAWLANEVGEQAVGEVYLRAGQVARVCGLAGVGASMLFGSLYPGLPYSLGGALYLLLALFLALAMPETNFRPLHPADGAARDRNPLRAMQRTLRVGAAAMRGSNLLVGLAVVVFILGASSEGWDRLASPHLLASFPSAFGDLPQVVWLGGIKVVGTLFTLALVEGLRRRLERVTRDPAQTAAWLLGITLMMAGLGLAFALAGSFWAAVIFFLPYGTLRALREPLYNAWVVQRVTPRARATMLSMFSQMDAFGQVLGGPAVGALGLRSLRAALAASALLLAPAAALFARARGQEQSSAEAAQPVNDGSDPVE